MNCITCIKRVFITMVYIEHTGNKLKINVTLKFIKFNTYITHKKQVTMSQSYDYYKTTVLIQNINCNLDVLKAVKMTSYYPKFQMRPQYIPKTQLSI